MSILPSGVFDPERLDALRRTALFDSPAEESFDRLTRLVSRVLGAPISLISLVGEDRQFFKSCCGLPEPWRTRREMPLSHSFCRHVVDSGAALVVEDARVHPLVMGNPAIVELGIVAYAGIPLTTSDGHVLGSLCAIDHRARRWTADEIETLRDLAQSVITEIELLADVAERRRVERALEHEREFLNTVLENLSDGVVACNSAGVLTLFNRATREIHGLPEAPLAPEHWAEHYALFGPDGRTRLRMEEVPLFRAFRGESVRDAEVVIAPRGAPPRVVLCNGRSIATADGRPVGAAVVMRDVTEQKRMEEVLREERDFALQVMNAMGQGLMVTNRRGELEFANPAFARMCGIARELLVGKTDLELVPPEERANVEILRQRVSGGESVTVELRLLGAGASPRHVLVSVAPRQRRGRFIGAITVVTDLTRQKEMEEVLRRSEESYRRLVEGASDIICRFDSTGRLTYANPVAVAITGYSAEELLERNYLELVREDHRQAATDFYLQQIHSRTPTTYLEFPLVRKDGGVVWLGQSARLLLDGERFAGFQATARDVTGRREVERMKDEFISVVSHELRTPLTALRGALGLIASGRLGDLDPGGQRMVELALQNADRMVRLTNDILDIERMESGRTHMEKRHVDAATLMEDAAATVRPRADRAGITVLVSPLFAQLHADPDRIVQTLTNLLENAIKFSPANTVVWLTAEQAAGEVVFHVRDQGRGIPADRLERIFNRFEQVDSSDSRQKGGTGLGLAICHSVVQHHGGRIWVESQWGEGSTFSFSVPLAIDEAVA